MEQTHDQYYYYLIHRSLHYDMARLDYVATIPLISNCSLVY